MNHLIFQGEGVSDTDIHTQIAQEIKSHFNRKPRPSISSAGIRLVAVSKHSFKVVEIVKLPHVIENFSMHFS